MKRIFYSYAHVQLIFWPERICTSHRIWVSSKLVLLKTTATLTKYISSAWPSLLAPKNLATTSRESKPVVDSGFRAVDSGFRITWSVFRIPKTKIHHFHKRKFPGFTNPDSLNYMGRTMGRLFPFPPIIQPQKASKCFSWHWQMEKIVNKINSFLKYIINPSFIDSGVRIKIQCQSFAGLAHQHNFQELLLFFLLVIFPLLWLQ